MAEAILSGVIDRGVLSADNVYVTDKSDERREYLKNNTKAQVVASNNELLNNSDVILFAVKPQNMPDVLAEIEPQVESRHHFISICAGTRAAQIEDAIRSEKLSEPRVVRVMPNTPALIGLGMAGVSKGAHATDEDIEFSLAIFNAIGKAVVVDESMMDAVTALTGSGPAYVFYLIESLIEGGKAVGFSEEQATAMTLQMVLGSATLATKSDKTPAELRRAVTSPGGTTAAGIAALDERKVREAFAACIDAAKKRGEELAKS